MQPTPLRLAVSDRRQSARTMLSRWDPNRIASVKSGNDPLPSRSALKKNCTVSLLSFRLQDKRTADAEQTRCHAGTTDSG